jgi:hypothetical protein
MKFLITESKLENIIFKYLDNQDFVKVEKNNDIYFVNSEGDEIAMIRFIKNDGWCYINYDLVKEIFSFFSMKESDSEQVIGRWVESTLQMKGSNTYTWNPGAINKLKVPYK